MQSAFLLAPTAAAVAVAGRVQTPDGVGVGNALVTLTDSAGHVRASRTSGFGYYRYDDVEAGQIVIIAVRSKRYQYHSQVVSVNDSLAYVDFVPVGPNLRK